MKNSNIANALGRGRAQAPLPASAQQIFQTRADGDRTDGPAPRRRDDMSTVDGNGWQSATHPTQRHGAMVMPDPGHNVPASRIDADLPAGVYRDSINQAMAPFTGGHQLPTGQTINVTMNAPNPHLSFKEWAARGAVGGCGRLVAWPFKLVGGVVEAFAYTLVKILGWIILLVLIPTMLMFGVKLAQEMNSTPTVEDGAAQIMHHGRHAVRGAMRGLTDDLPPEAPAKHPSIRHAHHTAN